MENNSFFNRFKLYIIEWLVLLSSLLVFGGFILYIFYTERLNIIDYEKKRLATQSKIINDDLSIQINAGYEALLAIKNKVEKSGVKDLDIIKEDFSLFVKILPVFRTFTLTDRYGKILVSNKDDHINMEVANKEYFLTIKNSKSQDKLFVSKPYKTLLGAWTVGLGLAIFDKNGEFDGIVRLNFEPEKLLELLNSVFYHTKDMRASIIHGDGTIFLITPDYQEVLGKNINLEGSVYNKYLTSSIVADSIIDLSDVSKDVRIQSFYTIEPKNINIDYPLYTIISRDYNSLFVGFNREFTIQFILFALISIVSTMALLFNQKKRYLKELDDIQKQKNKEQKLQEFAYLDSLTQISNRRYFEEILSKEWKDCIRNGKYIAIIMVDIDFFKLYNDSYGHQMGDVCLFNVATALKNTLNRPRDLVARYGGEEFIIILPDTNFNGAKLISENIRDSVKNLKIPHNKSSISDVVTISVGTALVLPKEGMDYSLVIKQADDNLYTSKNSGRDKVTITIYS